MKKIIAVTLLLSLMVFSCSKSSFGEIESKMAFESAGVPVMSEMSRRSVESDSSVGNSIDPSPVRARKMIMNAWMEITVKDVNSAGKELSSRALEAGGWIVSSGFNWGELSLVVKIPADKFDSFLISTEMIGEVTSKSINSDDVTEYFYDLDNRIKNKNILRDRFRDYLERADSIEDILSVERQLNDVTTEIERLEGSFRGLGRDINYSTVTFNLSPPIGESVSTGVPSFFDAFSTLKYKIFSFLYYLLFILIYLVIFGVPIVLVLGLIYVLGWGRVGFVRRFFSKLRR